MSWNVTTAPVAETFVQNGGHKVFHGEARSVLTPEDVPCPMQGMVVHGLADRAIFGVVGLALGRGAKDQGRDGFADQFFPHEAEHAQGRVVDEDRLAVEIDPENAFRRRAEDQVVPAA